ncbi:antioxidant AhpC/TSA family [Bacteroides intestinalis CAG:315]|jgi:cytochrome c biogenesis protein CcmG/thiol:disulfide interchange protein DsbE|uniref:TlpA family protein disulfide reductase n=2 Tax=Bacteroides intestinalis TaxID=329854 RepID=A0A412YLU4_9BACE|nr:TlpA family protein disulfide reductase [Bacteroides intestinalis]RHA63433.1 TlpA family protein disulfide reductase [Bacteroides intestinalis]RHE93127.1 TlpA family protein disulfide reductase [Bacteroides intestinalis]CDD95914.1 antioxidant AhpC/TSA family [Bacteroides intestinalis CAG:315]
MGEISCRSSFNILVMNKLFYITLFLLFTVTVSAQEAWPDVKVENEKGEVISTKEILGGKPAIVSFWGVTCKPCMTELNTLNELLEEWRKEVDFNVIAVSIDDSRFTARARSMAKGFDWDFICLFDKNQDLKRAMNVMLTPQTFVVDGTGKVVYAHTGYTPGSEYELLEQLKAITKK